MLIKMLFNSFKRHDHGRLYEFFQNCWDRNKEEQEANRKIPLVCSSSFIRRTRLNYLKYFPNPTWLHLGIILTRPALIVHIMH